MSKFNANAVPAKSTVVYTREGAIAYEKNPVDDWINVLCSSYLEDGYYTNKQELIERFLGLTDEVAMVYGYDFIAKAAMFARDYLGMRSTSELIAAWLNNKQFNAKRDFYTQFPCRPDDVAEMCGAIDFLGQKRSHAFVRGCATYLSSLGDYALGKYKMSGKEYNMYDLINIMHPRSEAINRYKMGTLAIPDTWETAISGSKTQEEKEANWMRLVEEKKLGYLALLRNLRNILQCQNVNTLWIQKYLVPQITAEAAICKSKVFPYQIYVAYAQIQKSAPLSVVAALEQAFLCACKNVPVLVGKTAIVLDVSGSMDSPISDKSVVSIKECGAVYAAMVYYANPQVDFIKFGDRAKRIDLSQYKNSPFGLIARMADNDNCGYGTQFDAALRIMYNDYDRILLISDMQIMSPLRVMWWGSRFDVQHYQDYLARCAKQPVLYSFDLGNEGNQIVDSNIQDVFCLTALSDKIFNIMYVLEQHGAIVSYIDSLY